MNDTISITDKDYYTTTKYRIYDPVQEDTIWSEIPRDYYYWYIVHPKLDQEGLYIKDNNNDNFLDAPLANQINIMNRWQYQNPETGWVSFLNVRFLNDEKQVGQVDFDPDIDRFTTNSYGSEINTERFDASAKVGYVFPETPYKTVGFQAAYSMHDQDSYFGFNEYAINHKSVYSNAIFNSILGSTLHKYKTGLSFTYDLNSF